MFTAVLFLLAVATPVSSQPRLDGPPGPMDLPVEEEVLIRLKGQPVGDHTAEALNLPEDFLRRVADRIVRMSYQNRLRMVVRQGASSSATGGAAQSVSPASPVGADRDPMRSPRLYVIGCVGTALTIILVRRVVRRRRAAR
jgi:hypothetical protein